VRASRVPKGASINSTLGCMARARAMPTRCFMPPEISLGRLCMAWSMCTRWRLCSIHSFIFSFACRRRHTSFSRDWSSDVCSSDLEVPSNALLADEFLDDFDGFSIGSNDMTQLTLGLDRDSALVAQTFDERDPAVKRMLSMAIDPKSVV